MLTHLEVAGATVYENTTDISSYSYDPAKEELVSYDTPDIVKLKVKYIQSKGMGGSMFWEVSRFLLSIKRGVTQLSYLSFLATRSVPTPLLGRRLLHLVLLIKL